MKRIILDTLGVTAFIMLAWVEVGAADVSRAEDQWFSDKKTFNAKTYEDDTPPYEWRFIKHIGWRKFTPLGAARKDWSDYRKYGPRYYWPSY